MYGTEYTRRKKKGRGLLFKRIYCRPDRGLTVGGRGRKKGRREEIDAAKRLGLGCIYIYMCMYVCTWEREREREKVHLYGIQWKKRKGKRARGNWSTERERVKKNGGGNRAEDISNQSSTTDADVNGAPSNRVLFLAIKKENIYDKIHAKPTLRKYMCLYIQ